MTPVAPSTSRWACAARALLLVAASTAAIVGVGAVLAATSAWCLALAWAIGVVYLAPFALVPLHDRWQRPPESSVLLAFVTGLGTWIAAVAILLQSSLERSGP